VFKQSISWLDERVNSWLWENNAENILSMECGTSTENDQEKLVLANFIPQEATNFSQTQKNPAEIRW